MSGFRTELSATASFLSLFLLCGCDPQKPAETTSNQPVVTVEKSSIIVPISVQTAQLVAALNQKFDSAPVLQGKTPELSAKLLVDEPITVEKAVQVLVTPAVPASCVVKQVPRTVINHVRVGVESFGCALTPWRWGTCTRDVFNDVTSTVYDDMRECTAEQAAVFKTVMQSVVELHDALFPTSVVINYEGWVHDITINVVENMIQLDARFRFKASADYNQGALGASVKVKGALSCTVDISLRVSSKITIGADGIVDVDVSDFSLDPKQFCIPGAVELANLATTLDPEVQKIRLLYQPLIKKELVKLINKEIAKQTEDDRDLKNQIAKASAEFMEPKPIGNSAWIQIRPEEFFLSQISGSGDGPANTIRITAGVTARPLVTIGKKPDAESSPDPKFSLLSDSPGVRILVQVRLPLGNARATLEDNLRSFMGTKFPKSDFSLAVSDVYQSGARMIVGLSVVRKSNNEKIVTGYYSVLSYLTDESGIALRDITIDDATRKAMLKVADWLVDSGVEKFIESKTRFDLPGETKKVIEFLNPFKASSGLATVLGRCEKLSENGIWIADKAINLLATADCRAQIEIGKTTGG